MKSGRMEAEVVRDSLLACGGVLNLIMGGQELENSDALNTYRRSLYYSVHPEQGGRNEMGELFDAPSPLDCYRRTRSIVPQQALALTNSDLVHRLSARVAQAAEPMSDEAFITFAFERILSRQPSDRETEICQRAMSRQLALMQKSKPEAAKQRAREGLVRALFNHNDFLTIR